MCYTYSVNYVNEYCGFVHDRLLIFNMVMFSLFMFFRLNDDNASEVFFNVAD
jgi:hypothetical protein